MRTIALGLLLATGAMVPAGAAMAQDQDHPHHEGRPAGDHPHWQGRPGPAAQPGAAPAPAAAPPQMQGRPDGYRGGWNRGGGAPGGFQPQGQQQPGQPGFQRPDRGGFDGRFGGQGYRPGNAPQVAPGSGGYRPQPGQPGFRPDRGPPIAPGSGGYRPQPGQYGYPPDRGPQVAPGSGGYRPQPGQYGYRPGGDGYHPAPPRPGPGGGWNRGWRDDRHYDYRSYRVQNNIVFRLNPYYAPRGWGYGYRRFSPGFTLSTFLFDQDYWIDDPYAYRLPPVWGPYRWVRYYNDALLVDVRSGVIVDAVYGIFWQ